MDKMSEAEHAKRDEARSDGRRGRIEAAIAILAVAGATIGGWGAYAYLVIPGFWSASQFVFIYPVALMWVYFLLGGAWTMLSPNRDRSGDAAIGFFLMFGVVITAADGILWGLFKLVYWLAAKIF